jgi:hypothetical protein
MALNSRSAIDPRWLTHNQSVSYGLQVATVQVYNAESGAKTYDAETNTWSGNATDLYTGPARIQPPTSSATDTTQDYNPTNLQTVRVILPLGKNSLAGSGGIVPDIRPNNRIRVTSSPYNTTLENFIYVVVGVLNSSNAWERTLLCKADIELDPNNV